ncbi:MAG: glycerol-3-phosphate 1-O-acyltransferase PlsY [Candidatus Dormibacteria bacterium]
MDPKQGAVILGAAAVSYCLGSLPFGLWLTRLRHGIDVRAEGSRSTGATNVLRVAGPATAAATFACDAAKGYGAVELARSLGLSPLGQAVCGVSAIAGHCWPVFAGFRGGKGVATGIGASVAVDPRMFVTGTVLGVPALAATKMVSVGSLTGAAGYVVFAAVNGTRTHRYAPLFYAAAAFGITTFRHRDNIGRIFRGEERRLSFGRKSPESSRDQNTSHTCGHATDVHAPVHHKENH